jgi:hypothetical protein
MAFTHQIDQVNQRLLVHVTGAVTFQEIVAHLQDESRDGALGYPELVDAREATAAFNAAEVRHIVALLEQMARSSRLGPTAVVVADDVTYGMIRMMGILVELTCEIQPFRDIESAERWLGWRN